MDFVNAQNGRNDRPPVFKEQWEARAFAITTSLQEAGIFTGPEWSHALGQAILNAQAAGDQDLGDTYYCHWLAALEELLTSKGVVTKVALSQYRSP